MHQGIYVGILETNVDLEVLSILPEPVWQDPLDPLMDLAIFIING
jgi:hypothetical protein